MDAYASEQEQVEQIRRWWKNNGTALLLGLALGIGGLGAYRYWDATQWTEHVSRAGTQFTDPPVA